MEKFTYPTETVTVDLGEAKPRELRYSLGTLRRLRTQFGISVLNGDLLRSLDESRLPELLFEGLVDKTGIADADALAEMIPPSAAPYLIQQFLQAFTGQFPTPDPNDPSNQPIAT